MNPDDMKKAWQTQTPRHRLTLDAELVVREVRRNQQAFVATVFWRDVREIGVSLVMVPVCLFLATRSAASWPWYLMMGAMLWIAVFLVVDRIRHRRGIPVGQPLSRHVEDSLQQVEHQIWLLRNVLWWYLLPPGVVFVLQFGQSLWVMRSGGWHVVFGAVAGLAVVLLLLAGVYWLNRYAVRAGLEPRRRELQELLASLQ
jgi:hypothetical protein